MGQSGTRGHHVTSDIVYFLCLTDEEHEVGSKWVRDLSKESRVESTGDSLKPKSKIRAWSHPWSCGFFSGLRNSKDYCVRLGVRHRQAPGSGSVSVRTGAAAGAQPGISSGTTKNPSSGLSFGLTTPLQEGQS